MSPHSNSLAKMAATPKTPAAATEVNSKPTPDTVKDLDKAIADVMTEIKGLDKGIKRLNERRVILTAKYEQLSETRQMYASEAIATEQNWQSGEFNEGIRKVYGVKSSFLSRIIQMVSKSSRNTHKRLQIAQISGATIANDKLYNGKEGRADDCSDRWREKFVLPIAGDNQRWSDNCHITTYLADGGSSVVAEKGWNRSGTAIGRNR